MLERVFCGIIIGTLGGVLMDLLTVFARFPDQRACIAHLEKVRWGKHPRCPYCRSRHVQRKRDGQRIGRWNCRGCRSSFNVLAKTIFSKTRVPLQKWLLAISLIVNAKKSLSSHQLARDLKLTQPTAWYLLQRLRREMASRQSRLRLRGILEADETFIGGKPRPPNKRHVKKTGIRGRGSPNKWMIAGVVERGGRLRLFAPPNFTQDTVLRMMSRTIDPGDCLLITDEYSSYQALNAWIPHEVIAHGQQYAKGDIHTNNIESAWAVLKRAHHGTHHHYTRKWTPMYIAEQGWKWNERHTEPADSFAAFLRGCMAAAP